MNVLFYNDQIYNELMFLYKKMLNRKIYVNQKYPKFNVYRNIRSCPMIDYNFGEFTFKNIENENLSMYKNKVGANSHKKYYHQLDEKDVKLKPKNTSLNDIKAQKYFRYLKFLKSKPKLYDYTAILDFSDKRYNYRNNNNTFKKMYKAYITAQDVCENEYNLYQVKNFFSLYTKCEITENFDETNYLNRFVIKREISKKNFVKSFIILENVYEQESKDNSKNQHVIAVKNKILKKLKSKTAFKNQYFLTNFENQFNFTSISKTVGNSDKLIYHSEIQNKIKRQHIHDNSKKIIDTKFYYFNHKYMNIFLQRDNLDLQIFLASHFGHSFQYPEIDPNEHPSFDQGQSIEYKRYVNFNENPEDLKKHLNDYTKAYGYTSEDRKATLEGSFLDHRTDDFLPYFNTFLNQRNLEFYEQYELFYDPEFFEINRPKDNFDKIKTKYCFSSKNLDRESGWEHTLDISLMKKRFLINQNDNYLIEDHLSYLFNYSLDTMFKDLGLTKINIVRNCDILNTMFSFFQVLEGGTFTNKNKNSFLEEYVKSNMIVTNTGVEFTKDFWLYTVEARELITTFNNKRKFNLAFLLELAPKNLKSVHLLVDFIINYIYVSTTPSPVFFQKLINKHTKSIREFKLFDQKKNGREEINFYHNLKKFLGNIEKNQYEKQHEKFKLIINFLMFIQIQKNSLEYRVGKFTNELSLSATLSENRNQYFNFIFFLLNTDLFPKKGGSKLSQREISSMDYLDVKKIFYSMMYFSNIYKVLKFNITKYIEETKENFNNAHDDRNKNKDSTRESQYAGFKNLLSEEFIKYYSSFKMNHRESLAVSGQKSVRNCPILFLQKRKSNNKNYLKMKIAIKSKKIKNNKTDRNLSKRRAMIGGRIIRMLRVLNSKRQEALIGELKSGVGNDSSQTNNQKRLSKNMSSPKKGHDILDL